ncbi:MAG: TIGR02147 family protein, partial [Bdellovibrionia bacterium]
AWIQKHSPFPIRTGEIEKSLEFLTEHGFLAMKDGKLTATDRNIQCLGGVFQLSLKNFHTAMLQLNQEALERFGKESREQIGYTLALPKSELAEVKKILDDAKNKIKELEARNRNQTDTVFHVNLSAFPIAGEGCDE